MEKIVKIAKIITKFLKSQRNRPMYMTMFLMFEELTTYVKKLRDTVTKTKCVQTFITDQNIVQTQRFAILYVKRTVHFFQDDG